MNRKIIFIILAVVVALGCLGFWYWRDTIFSKDILRLEILGPDQAKAGDEIEYTVKYKNNGNFALESPRLTFELPANSLTEDGKSRITQDIKDIYPGDENFVTFKLRLLGKEGDLKVAHAWLSYIPKNLSVRYEGDTTFTTKIDTVPVTLTFDMPSKVEKGKELSYAVNYFSNIDYPLENLSVKVAPVDGFSFTSSTPSSLDHVEWKLKTLQKAQGGRITVKGTVNADAGSHVVFSAVLGMWQNGTFVPVKEITQDVEVIQPMLFISQQINGAANYVANMGDTLHYEIFFRNIGTSSFDSIFAIARLDGDLFDLSTLHSDLGQARPNDNLIVFDPKQVSQLAHLDPQQEVRVDFTVQLKSIYAPSDAQKNNLVIKNKVNVGDLTQEFDTKVASKLQLSQQVFYSTQNGIGNSGPVPPQVDKPTTYTVVWQIKNYLNDTKNVKVRAQLPLGVTLTAKVVPDSEISHFSLDSTSRQIVWSVGDIAAGNGVASNGPSVSFQISFTPSFLQKGAPADLIGQAMILGDDQITGTTIQGTAPSVTTNLPDDSANSNKGVVQ